VLGHKRGAVSLYDQALQFGSSGNQEAAELANQLAAAYNEQGMRGK